MVFRYFKYILNVSVFLEFFKFNIFWNLSLLNSKYFQYFLNFATPKPSQSSKFSLEGFIISTSPPPPPQPNLFEPGAFKPGQGLPRQLGTSNLISRTLAKLKALRFQIFELFKFWISDFFQILDWIFQISDFGFQISDFRFRISDLGFFPIFHIQI